MTHIVAGASLSSVPTWGSLIVISERRYFCPLPPVKCCHYGWYQTNPWLWALQNTIVTAWLQHVPSCVHCHEHRRVQWVAHTQHRLFVDSISRKNTFWCVLIHSRMHRAKLSPFCKPSHRTHTNEMGWKHAWRTAAQAKGMQVKESRLNAGSAVSLEQSCRAWEAYV